jgi:hypothetical protein
VVHRKSGERQAAEDVQPNLSNLPFEQVVEGLLRTPVKQLRAQMAAAKKPAKASAKKASAKKKPAK